MAQLGSALDWGSRGRGFKSRQPDTCDVPRHRSLDGVGHCLFWRGYEPSWVSFRWIALPRSARKSTPSSGVAELVIFSVGVEQATGHGVYVYGNGTRTEIRDVEVRESRYDGVRVRLFHGAFAEIRDVLVVDSGRAEATQPDREQGGVSVRAMFSATAHLTGIHYLETGDERNRGDDSRDFAGIVVNTSEEATVNVLDASVAGPIDVSLQLTASGNSAIDVETLSIDGVSGRTEHAVGIQSSETARIDVSDFRVVDSGALHALVGDDSQLHLSRGIFDRSGTEAAIGAIGADGEANGQFSAHDLLVQNAPWVGMWVNGIAETNLTSVTLARNGAQEPGPGLVLMRNDAVQVTNSTVSNNNGLGIAVRSSAAPQQVRIDSTTIADNAAEQLAVLQDDSSHHTPSVHLRNSIVSGATELTLEGSLSGFERDYSGVTSSYSLWNGLAADFAGYIETTGDGNIVNADPLLGPLADNGGFTLTRLPASESPAIDAGDPDPTDTPASDQRGAARINGVIDAGSVEVGTVDEGDPGDGGPGDGGPGDGDPGGGGPGDGGPGDGGPGDGDPGDGGPGDGGPGDSDERLPVTGGTAELELLAFGGLALSAGFILLMLTRLRRQPA